MELIIGIIILAVYFAPLIIVISRKTYQVGAIFLINLLLGWTVIAWFVALIWAASGETLDEHSYRYGNKHNN